MIIIDNQMKDLINCLNCRHYNGNPIVRFNKNTEYDCDAKKINIDNAAEDKCEKFTRLQCSDDCALFSAEGEEICTRPKTDEFIDSECDRSLVIRHPIKPKNNFNCSCCRHLDSYKYIHPINIFGEIVSVRYTCSVKDMIFEHRMLLTNNVCNTFKPISIGGHNDKN